MRNKFLSSEYRVLSSAKLHVSDFSIKKNISFMNMLNVVDLILILEESHEERQTNYYERILF